jgi:uncharacterized protein (TIGR00369 family)
MPDPWEEPVRGGYPDPSLLLRPGIEQPGEMLAGRTPAPPISRLTGMRLTAVGDGTATFELPLTDWLRAPQGAISIGPLVIPADAAMAVAIQTRLPPRTPFSTSELTLRLLAPARPGARLRVTGKVIQVRQRIALAEGELVDEDDRLIAHGSTLCLMQPEAAPPPDALDGSGPTVHPEDDSGAPDPWQRPARGTVLDQPVWERLSGLQVLHAQLAGELPTSPIHHLIGLTLTAAEQGKAWFELPASEWLCAPARGRVQGGAVALLGEAALSAAIQTTLPPGSALAPIDLKVNYLRPLKADGRYAAASGVVVHAGRRLAVASAVVLDADGRQIAVATGSAMLLPGRPASLGAVET